MGALKDAKGQRPLASLRASFSTYSNIFMALTDPHSPQGNQRKSILVWDAPVRVTHWLMAFCFAGAYITAEWDAAMLVHVTFGYTLGGLAVWRLAWGLVGTRYAQFHQFVKPMSEVMAHVSALFLGQARQHNTPGHNPLGALAVLALLGLSLLSAVTGWATLHISESIEDLHEAMANLLLLVVLTHIAAVIFMSLLLRQSLVKSMVDGHQLADPGHPPVAAWASVGGLILAMVLSFWVSQWVNSAQGGVDGPVIHNTDRGGDRGHDDDDD